MRGPEQSSQQRNYESLDTVIDKLGLSPERAQIKKNQLIRAGKTRIAKSYEEERGHYTAQYVIDVDDIDASAQIHDSTVGLDSSDEWTVADQPSSVVLRLETVDGEEVVTITEAKAILCGPNTTISDNELCDLIKTGEPVLGLERPGQIDPPIGETPIALFEITELLGLRDLYKIVKRRGKWMFIKRIPS